MVGEKLFHGHGHTGGIPDHEITGHSPHNDCEGGRGCCDLLMDILMLEHIKVSGGRVDDTGAGSPDHVTKRCDMTPKSSDSLGISFRIRLENLP